jgi:hypothetical protein
MNSTPRVAKGAWWLAAVDFFLTDTLILDMPLLGLSTMPPQPQPAKLNMHPCILCGKNQLSHNQKTTEKQLIHKKQPNPQTNLWHP